MQLRVYNYLHSSRLNPIAKAIFTTFTEPDGSGSVTLILYEYIYKGYRKARRAQRNEAAGAGQEARSARAQMRDFRGNINIRGEPQLPCARMAEIVSVNVPADLSRLLRRLENPAALSTVLSAIPVALTNATNASVECVARNATELVQSGVGANHPKIGALIALIGLASVSFVVVRRH